MKANYIISCEMPCVFFNAIFIVCSRNSETRAFANGPTQTVIIFKVLIYINFCSNRTGVLSTSFGPNQVQTDDLQIMLVHSTII